MIKIKIWFIILSIVLILLDKYSFISTIRDNFIIGIQKNISIIKYKIINYPHWILLQRNAQYSLENENKFLRKELEKYAIKDIQQNNKLNADKELYDLQTAQNNFYEDFDINTSRAIIDINYLVNNKLLLDKGRLNNVKIGEAVVNKEGVVGQISSVTDNTSNVTLITNPEYKIYLQHNISGIKMLAQGIGNNQLIIKYINKNDKIKIGDILSTTGLDDIFPANIPVAKIVNILYENNGFNSAICQPIINYNALRFVSILENHHLTIYKPVNTHQSS